MKKSATAIKKEPTVKRKSKWKKLSIIILSIILFIILFLLAFIYTSLGVKLTTYTLNKVMPELKIEQIDGTFNNLTVKGLSLDLPGVQLKANDASLAISGLCLIKGKVCIKYFDADNVAVVINTNQLTPSSEPEPTTSDNSKTAVISMPVPIELRKTHLSNVTVNVDDMQFGVTDFTGKAVWVKETLSVYPAVATDIKAIFADTPPAAKNVEMPTALPLNETINQIFNKPLLDTLPTVTIPLNINIASLTGTNWLLHIGGEDYRFNDVLIKAAIENSRVDVKQLNTHVKSPYAEGIVTVIGDITLRDDWPVSASLNVDLENNKLESQFSGKLLGELTTTTKVSGLNQVNINAKINFIEKYLPLIADIKGSHLQWPIQGKAQYQLNDADIALNGSVQKYQLMAKGAIKAQGLPDSSFDILGTGTNEAATFEHAKIKLPQGDVNIVGKLSWLESLQWDILTNINNIDLKKDLPDYPIKLTGQVQSNGELKGENWQANISKLQLKGSVKQADLVTSGSFSVSSDKQFSANNLTLSWGKNRITMNGATTKGNLVANINLASLSLIANDMTGTIAGDIKMSGTVDLPTVDTKLNIDHFAFQNNSIEKANITGNIRLQDQVNGKITLVGQHINASSLDIKNVDIELAGNENSHKLTINIAGTPLSFKSSLTGHIDKERTQWTGTIPQALLQLNNKNNWQLTKALALSYNITNQIPTIGAHCWNSDSSSLCLEKTFSIAANNQANVNIKNIDLSKLPISSDGDTKLTGSLDGKIVVQWLETGKIPTINANITSKNVFILQMIASQALPIPFDLFTIDASFNEQQAKLNWKFSLKELGKINGNLLIDDPIGQKKLNGQLLINNLALALLNPLLQTNDYTTGAINGNLKFSGSLLDPAIMGNIDLKHSEIKSSQLPVDIQSAAINLNFQGKSSNLKGLLKTKAGDINIKGNANWNTVNNWKAVVTVDGAAMEVTVPPMLVMTVTPDIKVEATQDALTLSGKITIPKGKITVESLPESSIDVSSDEVMLDKNKQQIQKAESAMKINSNLEIVIGDKVMVDAFGLKAALKGDLLVRQDNKGLGVHGQIHVPSGRFHAYGQDLIIRKGEITFSGPTDQPMLNIEAIRNPESIDDNVTAGIRVNGLADDPKIEIFSDPSMSQQEALSYLLRGQGLASSEQGDNDMMTALLIGLGTAQGGKYIGDIGNVFGIKNLALDTQGSGNSSQVVVSGYILPNLQLKYGVGIFDSLATFTLRYRLLPRLYLEAASGVDQTLDLLYQFEF